MRRAIAVPVCLVGAGVAAVAYGALVERNWFRLRRFDVPVLSPGSPPLRILHISDIHLLARQRRKAAWLQSLADLRPDLVIDTGDNLGGLDSVTAVVDALGPLLELPGAFVLGSNDYYAPRPKNPMRYLIPDRGKRIHGDPLPWPALRAAFTAAGWFDASNNRRVVKTAHHVVELAGVDDPHLKRDKYAAVAGLADPGVDVSIALAHAPYQRAINAFADDGFALVLSGHTHGGQLRLPGYGALVANCDVPRQSVRWLTEWRARRTWLHVSAGLGTSPYAPVRFACPPEATLLTLVER